MNFFHITWVTHNSRTSERMRKYHVTPGKAVYFTKVEEIEITQYLYDIVKEQNIVLIAFTICCNHIHLIIYCNNNEVPYIVRKLKGKSAYYYKQKRKLIKYKLWAQKYNCVQIENDEQLFDTIEYIRYNRRKHNLPPNTELRKYVVDMITPLDQILD